MKSQGMMLKFPDVGAKHRACAQDAELKGFNQTVVECNQYIVTRPR